MALVYWRITNAAPPPNVTYDSYLPNNSNLLLSDYSGIAERSATTLRLIRPIVESNNYRHASPGSRISFVTNATTLRLTLFWNNLVTRNTYQTIGTVLVDGNSVGNFGSPTIFGLEDTSTPFFTLNPGSKTVTIVWPYCVGMELRKVELNTGSTLSIATRPAAKLGVYGDSISHGFSVGSTIETWAYKAAVGTNMQLINYANGSALVNAADATTALTGSGVTKVTCMIGYNNYVYNTDLNAFQTSVQGWLNNARTALPSAKIIVITPIFSTTSPSLYGHTTPLSSYRTRVENAVAAVGDPNTTLVDGLTIMTNDASRLVDGVHPNITGASEIASALIPIINAA